jgi:hypothetical protein
MVNCVQEPCILIPIRSLSRGVLLAINLYYFLQSRMSEEGLFARTSANDKYIELGNSF